MHIMENVWVLALLTELTFIFTATYFSYSVWKVVHMSSLTCTFVSRLLGKHYYATFNNLSAFLFTDTIVVTYRMDGTGKTFGLQFSRVILDVSCILVLSGLFIENRSESNKLLNKMFLWTNTHTPTYRGRS